MDEFYALLPRIAVWFSKRNLEKHQGSTQLGYILPVKYLNKQSLFALLQSLFCFMFFILAFIFIFLKAV
jgi:hypothetical protein